MSKRKLSQIVRMAAEVKLIRQGYADCRAGKSFDDWPRVENKYSTLWYQTKNLWQRGYRIASGLLDEPLPTAELPPTPVEFLRSELFDSLPISQRDFLREFSTSDHDAIRRLLKRFEDEGSIQFVGTGKKGSPIIIQRRQNENHKENEGEGCSA